MAINSVTSAHSATAHATATQAAKKPSKPFPSVSELMAAGQNQQSTNTSTVSNSSTTTGTSQTNKA